MEKVKINKLKYVAPRCEIMRIEGGIFMLSISGQEADAPINESNPTADDLGDIANGKEWGSVWDESEY